MWVSIHSRQSAWMLVLHVRWFFLEVGYWHSIWRAFRGGGGGYEVLFYCEYSRRWSRVLNFVMTTPKGSQETDLTSSDDKALKFIIYEASIRATMLVSMTCFISERSSEMVSRFAISATGAQAESSDVIISKTYRKKPMPSNINVPNFQCVI